MEVGGDPRRGGPKTGSRHMSVWSELVEQVDVAPVVGLAAGDRAEDVEPSDAVLSAQFVEAIDVDLEQLGHLTIVPLP